MAVQYVFPVGVELETPVAVELCEGYELTGATRTARRTTSSTCS